MIKLVEHHQAHAAAAFLPSPFSEAAILTVDGVGEWATSSINFGKESQIEMVAQMNYPNSVGLLYSAVTNYLGFKVNSGEYKVMGLAPYGDPKYLKLVKANIVEVYDDGSICLNKDYFNFSGQVPMATPEWGRLFKAKNRDSETELTRIHFDVAASIQRVTEEIT